MVDLDSNPTKLNRGGRDRQALLMTRGALTPCSRSPTTWRNISPSSRRSSWRSIRSSMRSISCIWRARRALSCRRFFQYALIIIALIPLALKGVAYRAIGAARCLRRNLMVYGVEASSFPSSASRPSTLVVAALHLV